MRVNQWTGVCAFAVELGFGIQSAGVCLGEAGAGGIVLVGEMQDPSPFPLWQSGQSHKQLFTPSDENRTRLGSGALPGSPAALLPSIFHCRVPAEGPALSSPVTGSDTRGDGITNPGREAQG